MIKLTALLIIITVICAGIFVILQDENEKKITHSEDWWLNTLSESSSNFTEYKNNKVFVVEWEQDINCAISTACLTPLVISHQNETEVEYNPLLIKSSDYQSKGVNTLLELTPREQVEISIDKPTITTTQFAKNGWSHSETILFVSSYNGSILGSPIASYLGIPIIYIPDNSLENTALVKETIENLGCKYGIIIGNVINDFNLEVLQLAEENVNEFFLKILTEKSDFSDYIVVCNPKDVTDYYWGESGHIPIPAQSVLTAQVAAYHKGIVFFGEGLEYIGKEFGDGFTQLGVELDYSNSKANITKEKVLEGVNLLQSYSMEAEYLCLVGGPVTLPFHYEDLMAYTEERQYLPNDYYFGDLDGQPGQELAIGRIISNTVFDASALVTRNLGFSEIKDYQFPKDDSSIYYDTVSDNWKENSMIAIGTTKIGPAPGILTPTLANQSRTMSDAGYWVTQLGYDVAQADIVREIIDEMNYNVYYGHGSHDSWYSAVANPVDADTINSVDLKPGFGIAMACQTSMTDNAEHPLDQYISLAFLNSGFTGYVGATRVAYGLYDYEQDESTGNLRGTDALYLVDVFSKKICAEDKDVGIALKEAKNALIVKQGWESGGESTQITVFEYVLYGDPASNLFVPDFDS